ncbi:MAG: AEC family transporter [Candidatus Wenzhouxiangella sp. M2_3B_020]
MTILLLIALGRLLAAGRLLPDNAAETLNGVVILLCLPALIFLHVPTLEPSLDLVPLIVIPWLLLAVSIALVLLAARALDFSRPVTAVLLVLVPLGNTSFLGFPLIEAMLGADRLRYAVVYDQFGSFLIVCSHVLFVLAWYGDGPAPSAALIARRIATFPPFIALIGALVLGNAWFPGWLDQLAQAFADMLLPLVTLAVGLQLKLRLVPEYRLPLAVGLAGKLVVLPAGALALGRLMGAESPILDVAVLESAMPPMITAAALASGARLAPQLASAMVAWGVLCSAATVPLWYAALGG